jgi:hypothetical protein
MFGAKRESFLENALNEVTKESKKENEKK